MSHDHHEGGSDRPVLLAIAAILVAFLLATLAGWTQPQASHVAVEATHDEHAAAGEHHEAEHAAADHGHAHAPPHMAAVAPFILLLGAIAVFPLVGFTAHWWESNTNRFLVAIILAGVTLVYYLVLYSEAGFGAAISRIDHAILKEYIPFIVLLFSLYVISGGIRIEGDMPAHPLTNATFLGVGGLLASFIGTTGAAMLLIRPLIETNKERKYVQHTVVFFIFVVCNCGGCLLPIGDPPLFLGYLEGVDFLWTMWALWMPWLMVNIVLIAMFYLIDKFYYYPKEKKSDVARDETEISPLRIRGLMPNALLLVGVILSVALLDPQKPFPGTDWHPFVYLREVVQLALVGLSLWLGSKAVRTDNKFNYHAIVEVAALFVGIFICMQPALELLNLHGPNLGIDTPQKFFWITGSLSAVLDNAPTYLVFFKTADAQYSGQHLVQMLHMEGGAEASLKLVAISLGAVFMGAMTYIGNGPNFMVRAIAEESGVRMPSFFGYVLFYSLPILLPVMVVMSLIFLR
ncbi:sodium:proton antiporter [Blastopirellula sp. J2-11]|uniref:sodium:proton antiporter n=1 Tax=Blastopirellula sp. J2-11 TaxID=2943192 RepID=UPI0021CA1FA0|nr:sodium:proton antiporter [Blastopirellula sp. J2-11]UUO08773.1 sodium:proton antiporter [Blastopirellula sp. J2-11]